MSARSGSPGATVTSPEVAGTARIPLRWMLGEAANVDEGLILNEAGVALLKEADPPGPPTVHRSWARTWRAVEQLPRKEIDNSGVWPEKVPHRGGDGVRDPYRSRRNGVVLVHATVGARHSIPGSVKPAEPKARHRATRGPLACFWLVAITGEGGGVTGIDDMFDHSESLATKAASPRPPGSGPPARGVRFLYQ
jgi:hypothetical protein